MGADLTQVHALIGFVCWDCLLDCVLDCLCDCLLHWN